MLTQPRALPRNGHVAVLALSSPSEMPRILEGVRNLEQYGLRVTLAPNIDHQHRGYLAGSDEERAALFNDAVRNPDYDAILFARGGYGAMRVLDQLDYDAIRRNPRPIIGFSDITALHQAIAIHAGVATFHGPMVNLDFHAGLSPEIDRWFWSVLSGDAPLTHRFDRSQVLFDGEAEGVLFGGCLSLTAALAGTPYDYWVEDGIWFWEEVGEKLYSIDRMLTHFRLSGRMRRIRGVIIGKLRDCGNDAEVRALLDEFFGSANIPVIRDLPFGHFGDNLVMPVGAVARISTHDCTFTLAEPVVQRR